MYMHAYLLVCEVVVGVVVAIVYEVSAGGVVMMVSGGQVEPLP